MNFNEVLDLHKAVSAFYDKTPQNRPKLSVFDMQNPAEGYILCVKGNYANAGLLRFLRDIAQVRKLGIREYRGYLVLYSVGTN